MEAIIVTISKVLVAYLLVGLVFSVYFLSKGIFKVDKDSKGSSWLTRLLFLPGTLIFWPLFLDRLLKGDSSESLKK
ncbi:MAG: hypothetical protein AAF433_01940 [Bacteroidota bacterium]